ncbi:hypothetical protein ACFP3U_27750 [Kitasatospora misakiensis]|uniref:Uncharacterized protein n=1 Tax=Kitasatospora misakiensis TaxID=67330 RepID=A0ABW0X865_9ACTN
MAKKTGASRWPLISVWLWLDSNGNPRVSLDPVKGVQPKRIPAPRDPVALGSLAARVRGALREAIGVEDPEAARRELNRFLEELKDAEKAHEVEKQQTKPSGWRSEPSPTPVPVDAKSSSIRTVSGGLPTLGRRH